MTQALAPRNPSHGHPYSYVYKPVEITYTEQRGRALMGFDSEGFAYPLEDLRAYDEIYLVRSAAIGGSPKGPRLRQHQEAAADLKPFVFVVETVAPNEE